MNGHCYSARVVLLLGLASLALRVAGATPSPVSARELARCAGIASGDERLACYDALAAPAPARSQDSHASTQAFGLTKPVARATPEGPELITALVLKVNDAGLSGGAVSVQLDNGQTWIIDASDVQLRRGDPVTVKRAALGSFLLISGKRSYRVKRME
jgi:hypothetical protein